MAQLEMFNEAPTVSAAPSVEQVRARLEAIFATLRCGDKTPASELRRIEVIVPQIVNWLPEDEKQAALATFDSLTHTARRAA